MKVRTLLIAALALLVACSGGGSDDDTDGSDAGMPPGLAIVAPGDSIGLAPSAAIELRVRYTSGAGEPIASAPITWTLIGGADGTGGSSITAAMTATDGGGEAAVGFVAGPERVDVRVTAQAQGAATVTFYISVSASGFAQLEVTPHNLGARDATETARVELRLYPAAELACADVDVDAPPVASLAPRTLATWDATAVWPSVVAEEAYTLLVWGVHAVSGAAVTTACVDVPASAVPPSLATVEVGAADRPIDVPPQALITRLELGALDDALLEHGAHRPWLTLACPAGPGQLLLDWIVDALSGDGALDGATVSPSGLGAQVQALRGAVGPEGCRSPINGGGPSLDGALTDAAEAGGWPGGAALAVLLDRRRDTFGLLEVSSELTTLSGALTHTLLEAESAGPGAPSIVLAETARPVLAATTAAAPAFPGAWPVAAHGFTLRTGSILRATFEAAALTPAGLGGRSATLGAALIDTIEDGGDAGCPALSALVCDAVGSGETCAAAACTAVGVALDGALAAWWRTADGVSIDLSLGGTATLADRDGDLAADPIDLGAWDAELTLLDGEVVDAPGTFTTTMPAE